MSGDRWDRATCHFAKPTWHSASGRRGPEKPVLRGTIAVRGQRDADHHQRALHRRAHDVTKASGFGDLSVHEVAMSAVDNTLAYFSYIFKYVGP